MRLVALVALTACWTGRASAAPSGPPPHVEHENVIGLPAVSADGATVVVAELAYDVRGGTQLSIRTIGGENKKHVVFTADDYLAGGGSSALTTKLADGDRWLAALHQRLDLRPLTVLEETSFTTRAKGQLSIEWKPSQIKIRTGGVVLERATPKSWLVETTRTPVADCVAEPRLADAAIDPARKLAAVKISYRIEADACGDVPSQWHVIRW